MRNSWLASGNSFHITSRFLRKISCFFCAFLGRMPTQSFLGGRLRRRGASVHERFTDHRKRQWSSDGLRHHPLECRAASPRPITRRGESARNIVPHLLATAIRICPAARPYTRRSARSDPGIFCGPAGTQKFERGPAREGTFAFLS